MTLISNFRYRYLWLFIDRGLVRRMARAIYVAMREWRRPVSQLGNQMESVQGGRCNGNI